MYMRSWQCRKARMYVEIRCIGRHRFLWSAHLTQKLNLSKQIFFPDCIFIHTHFLCYLETEIDQSVKQMATFGRQMNRNMNPSSYKRLFRLYGFQTGYGPHPTSSPIDIRVKVTGGMKLTTPPTTGLKKRMELCLQFHLPMIRNSTKRHFNFTFYVMLDLRRF
jgi:hypothetical protein